MSKKRPLLDSAFAHGESAGVQTAQLLRLLDEFGASALRRAIVEALQREMPRASSVAFLWICEKSAVNTWTARMTF